MTLVWGDILENETSSILLAVIKKGMYISGNFDTKKKKAEIEF